MVESERKEIVPSDCYDTVLLDLGPRKQPKAATGKCDACQVEDERNTSRQQAFAGDENAQREKADSEPADYSINDVRVCRGNEPRGSNKNAADAQQSQLSLRRIAKLEPLGCGHSGSFSSDLDMLTNVS